MVSKKEEQGGYVGSLFPDFFPPQEQSVPAAKHSAKQEIAQLKEQINALTQEKEQLTAENTKLKIKADAFDELLSSNSLFPTNVVAKSVGWSAIKLNEYLCRKRIQYKRGKVWVLYQEYADKGYTKVCWYNYAKDSKGRDLSRAHTYWTIKGVQFIREFLKKNGEISD